MIDTALTCRERQVLDGIRDCIAARGYPPTMRELATASGLRSVETVHWILTKLAAKGWIARDPGVARGIRLLDPEQGTR